MTGEDSYIDWDKFTVNSTAVVKNLDELSEAVRIFR